MCKSNGELVDHLVLHCPVAMDLWSIDHLFLHCPAYCFRAVRVLARQLWLSLKWLYMIHRSSLLNVVSLEGEK